jgi:secondary thiamine-phosphate synthase enzyme
MANIVSESGAAEGICSIYVTHATAAVVINENDDPNVCVDVLDALDKLIPEGVWRHDRVDGNAASHIKAAILGPGETVPVRNGSLVLGTWQAIMVVELDGPRDRRVVVTVR